MPPDPPVLALCVNWNGGSLLREALDSVLESEYESLTVVVVDCASSDASVQSIPGGVHLLELGENVGYAGGVNRGIRWAGQQEIGYEYLLVMNNDVRLDPDCLKRLVEVAEGASGACICGPKVLQWKQPDRLEASWGEMRWNHVLAHFHDQNRRDSNLSDKSRPVELLLGSILLISRAVIERLGPWDETFFLYHEEVDYLYRAAVKGVGAIYVPGARAYHWSGWGTRGSSLRKVYWIRRNTVYFLRKHRASLGQWLRFTGTLLASLVWNLVRLRWHRFGTIWRGVRDGLSIGKSGG